MQGLAELNVDLGGVDVDLGRLLDRAVNRQLNKKLSLVDASISKTFSQRAISATKSAGPPKSCSVSSAFCFFSP